MIDFRDRNDLGTAVVTILAIVILLGTLLFLVFVPKPTTKGMAKERRDREFQVRLQTSNAQKRIAEANGRIRPLAWSVPVSQVGPVALERVTKLAADNGLRLVAMRPQRTNTVQAFTELPFVVTVEGPFPAVARFLEALDRPDSRMTVSLVQIAALDGVTDSVSLTVGLSTFALPPQTKTASSPQAAPSASTRGAARG